MEEATISDRAAARALTGVQLRELHESVLEAYPDRHDLERLFFFTLDRRLNDYVGGDGMRVVVLRILEVAKAEAWLGLFVDAVLADRPDSTRLGQWARGCGWQSASAEPSPAPDQQLLDSTFFDLRLLRRRIRAARDAAGHTRVLGLGLHDTDHLVIRKVCTWLPNCLGESELKDPLSLRPDLGSVDARVKQILGYLPDLDSVNVVCPIHADGVRAAEVARFWAGLREHLGGQHRFWFVAVFSGSVEGGTASEHYPAEIAPLAAPVIEPHDLDDWAEEVVSRLRWPPPLAGAWTRLIMTHCWDGSRIDVRTMFEVMDRSIRDVRHRQPAFRRQLEELI